MNLTLSLVQMPIVDGDAAANRATAEPLVAEAAARGSDLLLLPELWGTGYDLANAEHHAASADPALVEAMAGWARTHGMWVGGSLLGWPDKAVGRPRNLFLLFDPDGQRHAAYGKAHRFRLMHEDDWLDAGEALVTTELPWGKAGLAVCYDLRFPELFRRYALDGAKLMLLPSQWPHPRLMHWRTLLRARAIENQCFVAAVNRVGSDTKGTVFFGHSAVIDPWGEIVIEGDEAPALLTATIDLALADEVRGRIPVFQDRRVDLYG